MNHPRASVAQHLAQAATETTGTYHHAFLRSPAGGEQIPDPNEKLGPNGEKRPNEKEELEKLQKSLLQHWPTETPTINKDHLTAMREAAHLGSRLCFFAGKTNLTDSTANVSTGADRDLFGPNLKARTVGY